MVPNPVVAARLVGRDYLIVVQEFAVNLVRLDEDPLWTEVTNDTAASLLEQVSEAAIHPRYDPARPADAAPFPTHGVTVVLRTAGPPGALHLLHFVPGALPEPVTPPLLSLACTAVAPSCAGLVFGTSGKGLCLETRNRRAGRGKNDTFPARCVVGLDIGNYATLGGEDSAGRVNVTMREGELYMRRCGVAEVAQRKYQMTAIALEDTVGRIAVGDCHGKVDILEFA